MKSTQILALVGISMLAMSNSCDKQSDISPTVALTTGRVIKRETTFDVKGLNPRPRWILDITPISLEGLAGKQFQQVKVFSLPDTSAIAAGQTISFQYQLVPYTQQTPWLTPGEALPTPMKALGAIPLPEIALTTLNVL